MAFFEGALSDPSNWVSNPHVDPTAAIESKASRDHHHVEPEEIVEAQIIDECSYAASAVPDTPPRIKQMVADGAFDRRPPRH
jgi:hypothetical protein